MKNYNFKKKLASSIVLMTILLQLFRFPILQVQALTNERLKDVDRIDVRLQDDFYAAVNKEWIENTKLENGYVSYGTFEELCGRVNSEIYEIIKDIEKDKKSYDKNSDELKVINLYENFLNIKKRNKMGVKPIESYMKRIDGICTVDDLKKVFSEEDFMYFQPLINIGVGADYKDSNMNILYFGNSNLILGNSLYYKSDSYEDIRDEYVEYIAKLHELYGENKEDSLENAEDFYCIEREIADYIPTYQEEAKDSNRLSRTYNVFTLDEINDIAPNIGIKGMLESFNIVNPNKIVVENPENIKFINSLITEDNLDDMKNYFKTIVLLNTDNLLTNDFRKASSKLKKKLYGVEVVDINESSAVKFVICNLCEVTSKLYVNKYFDKECKEQVKGLCNEIIDNYRIRLNNIDWMTKETKEKAVEDLGVVRGVIASGSKGGGQKIRDRAVDNGGVVEEAVALKIPVELKKTRMGRVVVGL